MLKSPAAHVTITAARRERGHAEADLKEQRPQERQRADHDPEAGAREERRDREGRDAEQREIDQRLRRAQQVHDRQREHHRTAADQRERELQVQRSAGRVDRCRTRSDASPSPVRMNPSVSNERRRSGSKSAMNVATSARPRIPIGMFKKKIQRHDENVVMKPPTGGPSIGAISAGRRDELHHVARGSRFSVPRRTTRRPTGTIIAPPTPCKMRAAVNVDERVRDPAQHRRRS